MNSKLPLEEIIIIGGGPAGLSSAIYLARAGLKPLVFAGSPPGGQLTLTSEVENYPGFDSILGTDLVDKMRKQAEKFGARIVDDNVLKVDFSKKTLKIYINDSAMQFLSHESLPAKTRDLESEKIASASPSPNNLTIQQFNNSLLSKSVLIATGAKALWLGLESETRLRGKGVSACATCDGFFFRGKTVAVVGGGDTALEEALTLTKFASKVYIIHRRDEFRASKIMIERVKNSPKIEIIYNAIVEDILGENRVEELKLKITDLSGSAKQFLSLRISPSRKRDSRSSSFADASKDKEKIAFASPSHKPISTNRQLKIDGLFVAIGHKPDTELFKGKVELDSKGYVITSERLSYEVMKSQISSTKPQINSKFQNPNHRQIDNLKIDYWKLFGNWNLEIGNYRSSTSVRGVFAAGDCVDHIYRQASTAVGMGVAAALDIEKWLESDSVM